ncbi:MAG TPA: gamma-glutamyltransferase, partial [Acidimicrobiales bacterium]|nr:gamma-glutamyltransferase [Acidimicrobiales bacterium]
MTTLQPVPARFAPSGLVCAIDHLAAGAGADLLRRGGSAADAAVATSAVLAVTSQQVCGMGGDLWAVVHTGGTGGVVALNASGRAGSGADPERLRRRGLDRMPAFGDPASVTVPGCVDGWLALHQRFGRLPLADVLAPARRYAVEGFPASPALVASFPAVAHLPDAEDYRVAGGLSPGSLVRRPGVGRALDAIIDGGRDAFYQGEFAAGFIAATGDEHRPGDLARPHADWVDAVSVEAWGHRLWTAPPNSQGYLTLAAAWIAGGLDLPDSPEDPRWAHLLLEAARQAGYDRLAVLHEGADAAALLDPDRLGPRRAAIDPERAGDLGVPAGAGDTIGLCAVDADRQGVSLIQSNASGWGSGLIVPGLRIFLHNRGRGFSLEPGHPAEYGPGRRPPHTLAPTLVTGRDGRLRAVLATMGGDGQPQILLQLIARLLRSPSGPSESVAAGRWALGAPLGPDGRPSGDGFETWRAGGRVAVHVEGHAAAGWAAGLRRLGHEVVVDPAWSSAFGHAHAIDVGPSV